MAALLVLALPGASASAHSAFLGSVPEPGARVERSPDSIRLTFTEPVNRGLTTMRLRSVRDNRLVPITAGDRGQHVVLHPTRPLARGAYRVEWHTVSTDDGHALEGSFSFGMRAAAVGAEHTVQQSPLARGGGLRIAARWGFYAMLVLFTAGVWLRVLLRTPGGSWLVPPGAGKELGAERAALLAGRHRRVVVDAGLAAAALAIVVSVAEAADAAGGLAPAGLTDYLLSSQAGVARLVVVGALGLAAASLRRVPVLALVGTGVAVLAVAGSGHANSAQDRTLAVATDALHLLAGSLWLGGIALILAVWGSSLRGGGTRVRATVIRLVLPRFGRVALPAFVVVVLSGTVNALLELGHPSALWTTAYGRVLLAKVLLVSAVATASYGHALRLRPRLLAAGVTVPPGLDRRHWRLLRGERGLAVAVFAAAALLVAFPLPPRQLLASEATQRPGAPCDPCPLRTPAPDELAVAAPLGRGSAAAWIRRTPAGVVGEVRTYDLAGKPSRLPVHVLRAREAPCGDGCRRFLLASGASQLSVRAQDGRGVFMATLPTRWVEAGSIRARRLLRRAEGVMRRLRSVREDELVTSGPGNEARTVYRVRAPDRSAWATSAGVRDVTIGRREWQFRPGEGWTAPMRTAGGLPFRARSWFRWTPYAIAVRLLEVRRHKGRRVAIVATMDPGTPVWMRLRIDLRSLRVLDYQFVASGSYWRQRFSRFNRPVTIEPPPAHGD